MTNQVDRVFEDSKTPLEFSKGYINHLTNLLNQLDHEAIASVINLIMEARENGKKIIFLGNGGSAATASHFANDIGYGTRTYENPFRVYSITDNNAILTALGNDEGYENIFIRQLQVMTLDKNDLVFAISASGNSPNVIKAIEYANEKGATTIGLSGFDGGKLKAMSKYSLHVQTEKGEYGPVEDVHMIFDHLIGNYLLRAVKKTL